MGIPIETARKAYLHRPDLTVQNAWETCEAMEVDERHCADNTSVAETAAASSYSPLVPACDEAAGVSEALLHSRPDSASLKVVDLEYSRNPKPFHDVLRDCPELEQCREELKKGGFDPQLPSGAYVFVHPEHFAAVVDAIRTQGIDLKKRHVVVNPELEDITTSVIERLPGRLQIRVKSRTSATFSGTRDAQRTS